MKNLKYYRTILNVCKALILPVLVFAVFAILTGGRSASGRMLMTTLRQSVVPSLICYGIVLNVTIGMVNFSGGASVLLSGIIGGNLALLTGTGIPGMIIFCILIGLLTGSLTGLLYIKMRVPAMVLTIGMMLVYEAFPRLIFSGGLITPAKNLIMAQSPYCFIVLGIMLLVFYVLYNKTEFGHNLRAIGANQSISNSVGINLDRTKFISFIVGGLFIGVAAFMYISSNNQVLNVGALGSMLIMMDGFMGMFLSLFISRYINLAFAVPISVFTMKMISNGFVSLSLPATMRDVTNGLVLLVVLAISANQGLFAKIKSDKAFAEKANAAYKKAQS